MPAAVVTVVRGRLLLFFCGWLTAGALWFIGALLPDPDGSERDRQLAGIATAATAVALVVLGFFGARPAPLLGMNGSALQNSVGGVFGPSVPDSCERKGENWICGRYDRELSGSVSYRVRVNGLGCWKATRLGNFGERAQEKASGCAGLADYVFD